MAPKSELGDLQAGVEGCWIHCPAFLPREMLNAITPPRPPSPPLEMLSVKCQALSGGVTVLTKGEGSGVGSAGGSWPGFSGTWLGVFSA